MKDNIELSRPLPQGVIRASSTLNLAGNIGFWLQLVLGVIAAVILLLSAASVAGSQTSTQGTGFSLVCATSGVLALIVSIFFFFRYRKIARLIRAEDPAMRPKKGATLQNIKMGLIANLVGMILSIVGAEAFIGVLWQKLSNLPQGAAVYDTTKLPQPNEILIILANTHTIMCHFVGIVIALWLLDRLNR